MGLLHLPLLWASRLASGVGRRASLSLVYVTPRLLVDLGGGLVLRAGAQIPLVRDLNGYLDPLTRRPRLPPLRDMMLARRVYQEDRWATLVRD